MAVRFFYNFETFHGEEFRVRIHDAEFVGTSTEIDVDNDGFLLKYDGSENPLAAEVKGSSVAVKMLVTPANASLINTFATDLIGSVETRFSLVIHRYFGSSESFHWAGYLLPDLSGFDDIGASYYFTIKAGDGLGRLKSLDYSDDSGPVTQPFGFLTFKDHLIKCLNAIEWTPDIWGAGDWMLSTTVNWQDGNMSAPTASKCPLAYSRVSGEAFAERKESDGAVEWKYKSYYDVLQYLCEHWRARLLLSQGAWRFEQIRERMQDTFYHRRFDTAGTLVDSTATQQYDHAVNQSGDDFRLSGGVFSYEPALSYVEVEYDHKTQKNYLALLNWKWYKDSGNNTPFEVTGISFDSDSYIRVSGMLNIDVSVGTYTKPWRYVFGIELAATGGTSTYKLKSLTKPVVIGGTPIPTLNRTNPEWLIGGVYYEVSTGWIFSNNFKGQVPFSFWTPIVPSGATGFSVDMSDGLGGEDYYEDTVSVTVNDWKFTDLSLNIIGIDNAANFESKRIYKAANFNTGNSLSLEYKSVFGHAISGWTVPKIMSSSNGTLWSDTTATWDRGSETNNREFGSLIAAEIQRLQTEPLQTYSGTIWTNFYYAHERMTWADSTAWLLAHGELKATTGEWKGLWFRAGVNAILPNTPTTTVRTFTGGIFNIPGTGAGGMVNQGAGGVVTTGGGGLLETGFVVNITNYAQDAIPAGTVTTIPVQLPIRGNTYFDGDEIYMIDPTSGIYHTFTVDGDVAEGATSINVVSTTIDTPIPIGAPMYYSVLNQYTSEGGNPGGLPGGTPGHIMRRGAEVWESYGGAADDHVLKWTAALGWHSAAAPGGGGGTVTSVGVSVPAIFSVSGSPVTTSGTITVSLASQSANTVWAGPTSGGSAAPTFRALVAADIPALPYLSGNQTITLSGDASGSGATAITVTLGSNVVSDAKFRQSAGLSVVGRSANTTGNVADITAGTDGHVLRRSGTTVGFGQVATAGITDAAVTYAKIQNITTARLLGRSTAGAGVAEEISIGSGLLLSAGVLSSTATGTVTGSGSAGHLAYWTTSSNISFDSAQLFWDATNNRLGVGTSSPSYQVHVALPTAASASALLVQGDISGNIIVLLNNTNNANTNANTLLTLATGGGSAGDPVLQLQTSGGATWAIGLDNSDNDSFKIASSSLPGTSDRLIITTAGNVGIGTVVTTARVNIAGSGTTSSTYSLLVNNNSASTVLAVRDDLRVGIMTTSPTQELHVNGDVIARQYINTAVAPTIAFGTGAGTSPVLATLDGGVNFIRLQFTCGTTPTTDGPIFTLTLNQAYPSLPIPVLQGGSKGTQNELLKFYVSTTTTNSFTVTANGTLVAGSSYLLYIHVGGF